MAYEDIRQPYRGPERRRGERRTNSDRREEFRFGPKKADRREGSDRRRHGGWDGSLIR